VGKQNSDGLQQEKGPVDGLRHHFRATFTILLTTAVLALAHLTVLCILALRKEGATYVLVKRIVKNV